MPLAERYRARRDSFYYYRLRAYNGNGRAAPFPNVIKARTKRQRCRLACTDICGVSDQPRIDLQAVHLSRRIICA